MEKHAHAELIEKIGGTCAVARLFGIKPPSVSDWKKRGIPSARWQTLELLRPDIFGAVPEPVVREEGEE